MRAEAFAKVNLSLQVRARDASGFHPLRSLIQSIDWSDRLELTAAYDDRFRVDGPGPRGEDNLAWQAVAAVRRDVAGREPLALALEKRVPVAAGLGGGSADAAAALQLACRHFDAPVGTATRIAPDLGSDVPFCLVGGFAMMEGRGEIVTPVGPVPRDYALAVAVPPLELPTGAVYDAWDRLGGPEGEEVEGHHLPPSLRGHAPLRNDLYPAAVAVAEELADLRADLQAGWGRPVLMSGSGSALFAFFLDAEEAGEAVASTRLARAKKPCLPVASGVQVEGGTLP